MVHQLLYCETDEADLYHRLFIRSAERAKIDFDDIEQEIVGKIEKEFERRINRKASAKESFGADLIFFQILKLCMSKQSGEDLVKSIEQPEVCVLENIDMLLRIKVISLIDELYATSPKGKKLYCKLIQL